MLVAPRDTVSAFATLRGTSARCAGVIPVSVWRKAMWYESPLCRVIPYRAFSTLRGTKARCAEVVPVSVIPPSAVARVDGA